MVVDKVLTTCGKKIHGGKRRTETMGGQTRLELLQHSNKKMRNDQSPT
jgi:hypothetical protein